MFAEPLNEDSGVYQGLGQNASIEAVAAPEALCSTSDDCLPNPIESIMEYFTQQLINGLTLGSIYGLIAIGYTMVYGIIGMINFAHGEIFMVGAFHALIFYLLAVSLGFSFVLP